MAGPVGLDYVALYPLLDRAAGSDAGVWDALFDDITVMESAALEAMRQDG